MGKTRDQDYDKGVENCAQIVAIRCKVKSGNYELEVRDDHCEHIPDILFGSFIGFFQKD